MLRRGPKAAVSKHEAALILRDARTVVRCCWAFAVRALLRMRAEQRPDSG
jgi:hypothetical protein